MKSLAPVSRRKLCCFVVMYPKGFNPGRSQNGEALTLSWRLQHWWATISLQRSACISVCQGTLVQSSGPLMHPGSLLVTQLQLSKKIVWWGFFFPALLAASRDAYCLEAPVRPLLEQGWEQGWTCHFCCAHGSSVTKKDQISSRTIGNNYIVSQPCILSVSCFFCLVNNLKYLLEAYFD